MKQGNEAKGEVGAVVARIKAVLPVAKRNTDPVARELANAELRGLYARMAEFQAAGAELPTIDAGAL